MPATFMAPTLGKLAPVRAARNVRPVCPARAQTSPRAGRAADAPAVGDARSASASLRVFGAAVLGNVMLVAPAFAEPGKIFDFNATLPLMAAQFLLLMLVLDKLVYSPVGAVLDSRDAELRTKLESVRDTSDELLAYTNEANAILTAARNDAAAAISKAKAEADAQSAVKIGEAKKKLDAELKTATAALEVQRKASYAALDKEVDKLSASIVKKVLTPAA